MGSRILRGFLFPELFETGQEGYAEKFLGFPYSLFAQWSDTQRRNKGTLSRRPGNGLKNNALMA